MEMVIDDIPPVLRLPTEVLLLIATLLDVEEVLTLRQTCTTWFKATNSRSLWISLFHRQQAYLPTPPGLGLEEPSHLQDVPTQTLERSVRSSNRIAYLWPRLRTSELVKLSRVHLGVTMMGMQLFLERWLLVVYSEGAIYVFDTKSTESEGAASGGVLRARVDLQGGLWSSYVASLDSSGEKIVVAIARSVPPYWTRVYEISLGFLGRTSGLFLDSAFELVQTITLPSPQTVRAIETTQQLVALYASRGVELVHWGERRNADQERMLLPAPPSDLEDLWNGIIAVQFMGPYILIFKTRSVELQHYAPILDPNHFVLPTLKQYVSYNFRDVTFSRCKESRSSTDDQLFSMTVFANDVIQGLYQIHIKLTIPHLNLSDVISEPLAAPPVLPSLDLAITDIYPLTMLNVHPTLRHGPLTPTPSFSLPQIPGASHVNGTGSMDIARGFLSAYAVGPQGTRAIWIERKRASTIREIQVWGLARAEDHESVAAGYERKVVYSVTSYDLRDDVICCTFGESSGIIILGNRSGDVSILALG
ncbi:hypothetical protein K443DRAFT_675504 [Laccaria amethystina LaAM-08-1]|uniref:F-box domain-containing protein n=1 Tax=Laccaria amethystina LaAM-08-1 TaxID=1095629 RepID=A0A0C9XTQ5_9AGAR|nr:hypothetical protein K443DRAFT_675504 [Laccaria amethystina LaAM-08-1]